MHNDDSAEAARRARIQTLCSELSGLVDLSRDQRRALEELLTRLERLAEEARTRPLVRAAGSSNT
jgi:hypothetical protein